MNVKYSSQCRWQNKGYLSLLLHLWELLLNSPSGFKKYRWLENRNQVQRSCLPPHPLTQKQTISTHLTRKGSKPSSFTCYPFPSFPCFRMHVCVYDLDTWLWPLLWFPSHEEESWPCTIRPSLSSKVRRELVVCATSGLGGRVLSRCLLMQPFTFTNKTTWSRMAGSRWVQDSAATLYPDT